MLSRSADHARYRARSLIAYYLLFAGLLTGPAWITFHYFDLNRYPAGNDVISYLDLAQGVRPANPVHYYRVIVPLAARALADAASPAAAHKNRMTLLRGAFFIVNLALTAAAALVLFLTLLDFVPEPGYAIIGVLAFLLSRDVIDQTGLPSIDSPLYLTVAASFYAIRMRSEAVLAAVLLFGPLVKETFAFLVPILFFFGAMSRPRIVALLVIGYLAAFGMRAAIDISLHTAQAQNLSAAVGHAHMIPKSLHDLLDGHGELNLLMTFGPFWFIVALGFLGGRDARAAWLGRLDAPLLWWLPLVAAQALLSGNFSRMVILGFPTMGAAVALILSQHPIAIALVRGIVPTADVSKRRAAG